MTLAHAGHWLLDLLYAAPLLFVIGFIVRDRIKQRRLRRREAAAETPAERAD